MIASSTLAPNPALDLKTTRTLPLSNTPSLEFGKSAKQQHSLPQSNTEDPVEQQTLNQHLGQVIEQQITQVTDTPAEVHSYKPLALGQTQPEPLIELLDLDDTINPDTKLHQHKPLALGQHPNSSSHELHQHKPLALNDKASSLDIQLLTENSSAILIDPNEQFLNILQTLLKNTSQENPLYWIENNIPASATQVATEANKPNLAWQESLWF